ncbi:hypothetical protein AB0J86_32210 [Micromonospora sp. NPDC049559]|uniref:hypothetical protein n=1 Tax=Micromonospora sp. NPDC049559 TaxID=3155923 RepID=UPI0034319D06
MLGKETENQEVIDGGADNRAVEPPSPVRSIATGRHRAARMRGDLRRRLAPVYSALPVRLGLAAMMAGGLAFVVTNESRSAVDRQDTLDSALAAQRADELADQRASRYEREPIEPIATPSATATAPPVTPSPSPSKTVKRAPKPAKPARPKPVAGLTQAQMDNANTIVKVGVRMKVPRKGLIVAIATAMQESNLYNLANASVPESLDYPNQGVGYDNDSVGLFQQRSSSGWGAVADLMRPAYAAEQFFAALLQIPGWQQMSVTSAAQAVQVSAFPDAYAPHEGPATTVVSALLA